MPLLARSAVAAGLGLGASQGEEQVLLTLVRRSMMLSSWRAVPLLAQLAVAVQQEQAMPTLAQSAAAAGLGLGASQGEEQVLLTLVRRSMMLSSWRAVPLLAQLAVAVQQEQAMPTLAQSAAAAGLGLGASQGEEQVLLTLVRRSMMLSSHAVPSAVEAGQALVALRTHNLAS